MIMYDEKGNKTIIPDNTWNNLPAHIKAKYTPSSDAVASDTIVEIEQIKQQSVAAVPIKKKVVAQVVEKEEDKTIADYIDDITGNPGKYGYESKDGYPKEDQGILPLTKRKGNPNWKKK